MLRKYTNLRKFSDIATQSCRTTATVAAVLQVAFVPGSRCGRQTEDDDDFRWIEALPSFRASILQ